MIKFLKTDFDFLRKFSISYMVLDILSTFFLVNFESPLKETYEKLYWKTKIDQKYEKVV